MNIDPMMRTAPLNGAVDANAGGGANANAGGDVIDLGDRVHRYVRNFFPEYKKKELAEPPHVDAFYSGLKNLKLRQPKPGDSAKATQQLIVENRKTVYRYVNDFTAGTDRKVYRKMIDRGLVLVRSGELLEQDISYGRQEKATLGNALKTAFTAVSGLHSMSRNGFYQAMMLGDEAYELEKEW